MVKDLHKITRLQSAEWTSVARQALVGTESTPPDDICGEIAEQPVDCGLWVVGDPIVGSAAQDTPMTKSVKKPAATKPTKKPKSAPSLIEPVNAGRPGSKSYLIQELLGRQTGATIKELVTASGWQDHSVRGFMSGTLKKKHGLAVSTEMIDGIRHYRLSNGNAGR